MPNAKTKRSNLKLSALDWIEAAMKALAAHGVEGVRVEAIAKRLGVTKGSFYWHFEDRSDLLKKMIDHWQRLSVAEVEEASKQSSNAKDILKSAIELPFLIDVNSDATQLALAIRLWAQNDPRVASVVAETDNLRIRHLARLLATCGFDEVEAIARGTLIYAYMRTAIMLVDPAKSDLRDACRRILMGES